MHAVNTESEITAYVQHAAVCCNSDFFEVGLIVQG
jgi:hypothetical protein